MHGRLTWSRKRKRTCTRKNLRGTKKKLEQDLQKDYIIDGTERPIQRPGDQEEQKEFYSGKSHQHAVKNNLIINLEERRIDYLSDTVEGKKHDKALCDDANLDFPEESTLIGDLGFQGYEPKGAEMVLPYKKPRGGELTEGQKQANKQMAS